MRAIITLEEDHDLTTAEWITLWTETQLRYAKVLLKEEAELRAEQGEE